MKCCKCGKEENKLFEANNMPSPICLQCALVEVAAYNEEHKTNCEFEDLYMPVSKFNSNKIESFFKLD